MFGKPSKRWASEAVERGLTEVPDARAWIGVELDLLELEVDHTYERKRLLTPNLANIGYRSVRKTEILRSAVNTSLLGSGLLACLEVKTSLTVTRPGALYLEKTSPLLPSDVIVGRLARPIEGHLLLAPQYSPSINTRFENAVSARVGDDLTPVRLEHELLQYWWVVMGGSADPDQLAADRSLCALLWAIRAKVSRSKIHVPSLAAEYEALIPLATPMYDSPLVEILGDVVALHRGNPSRGIDDAVADQVEHITAHFS
jgi:hypothetical protein